MATAHFLNWVERQADLLRARCALAPFARLDPFELAKQMDIPVLTPHDIAGLDPTVLGHLLTDGAGEWDAGTLPLSDETHVVVMNPTRVRERQHASLMEELAHISLKHKPSGFRTVNGIVLRGWKQTHETQAFWVGAAALVPRRVMRGALTRRLTVAEVAADCGVSHELVGFRERVLGVRLLRVC